MSRSRIYPISHYRDLSAFRGRLRELGRELPVDEHILSASGSSPLAQPLLVPGPGGRAFKLGNRWCIHPMEGWDGTLNGRPSAHTFRRWERFGASGAKLIWGGEAVAVQHDGRANPRQLCASAGNAAALGRLLERLRQAHRRRFGPAAADDLLVGLQLTHSGRFSRPNRLDRPEPKIVYHHPLLDRRVGIDPGDDSVLITDDYIRRLIDRFIQAAAMAWRVGFQFVDIKHCHGYLGHEFLSAFDRPGPYGGDLAGRSRFLRQIVDGIRAESPGLLVAVRLSLFDQPPFQPDPSRSRPGRPGVGRPCDYRATLPHYPGFGCRRDDPIRIDLTEPLQLLKMLCHHWGVRLVNLSAGSPYYNPHVQRPAFYPPSDGYQPPEDPLVGCLRQIHAVREVKRRLPDLILVGSAYSYFQQWLPQVAQGVVRAGWVDSVGIGRMALAYPDLIADCLEAGAILRPKQLCRTFSDCTTAPRHGLVSGCFPLDEYYKRLPEHERLRALKAAARRP